MAARLNKTVGELKSQITPTELQNWMLFIEWEETRTNRVDHYYLAQIAAQITKGIAKHPEKVKLEQFLFRPPMSEDQIEKMNRSKMAWGVPPELIQADNVKRVNFREEKVA